MPQIFSHNYTATELADLLDNDIIEVTRVTPDGKIVGLRVTWKEFQNLGGGSGSVSNVTYSELTTIVNAAGLTPGSKYLLSDFRTRHEIPESQREIHVGDLEPLILTAATEDTFELEAFSTIYPQDIIHYKWEAEFDVFIDDPAFQDIILGRNTYVGLGGDKGVITYRKDTRNNLEAHYDWRNTKFRRWQDPVLTGIYNQYNEVPGQPFEDYYTFNNLQDPYTSPAPSFSPWICKNNYIGPYNKTFVIDDPDSYVNVNILNNTIFITKDNRMEHIDNLFMNSYKNTIYAHKIINNNINCSLFEQIIVEPRADGTGGSFELNTFEGGRVSTSTFAIQVAGNVIINGFWSNNIFKGHPTQPGSGNFSGNKFVNATVRNNDVQSQQFTNNSITGRLENNTISTRFDDNKVDGSFNNCTLTGFIVRNFQYNHILAGANVYNCTITMSESSGNDVNFKQCVFLPGGQISENFNNVTWARKNALSKSIFTREDGQARLSYYNNSDVLVVVPATT